MIAAAWALLLAQASTPAGPAGNVPDAAPASLTRIRKALAETGPTLVTATSEQSGDHPVFRLRIQGFDFSRASWDPHSAVPGYVRPPAPLYHYEFMKQVTPEFFRASVLYPGYVTTPYGGVGFAVPLTPIIGLATDQLKRAVRSIREQRARDEVREALRQLEKQRQAEQQKRAERKD